MANVKKLLKEVQINKVTKGTQMNKERLAKKADFLANNHFKPMFRPLALKAKQEWIDSGKKIREYSKSDYYEEIIIQLNRDDLRSAMRSYVFNHGEEILEMERLSNQRYRLRQKYKLAKQKVDDGFFPVVKGNGVTWVYGPNGFAINYVDHGYVPIAQNKELVWEPVISAYGKEISDILENGEPKNEKLTLKRQKNR